MQESLDEILYIFCMTQMEHCSYTSYIQ